MLYLMNSPVLTGYGTWKFLPVTTQAARNLLKNTPYTSAIGHESTARFLSTLLGLDIPVNRIQVDLTAEDIALVFRVKIRLAEGIVLTASQIADIPYELGQLQWLSS